MIEINFKKEEIEDVSEVIKKYYELLEKVVLDMGKCLNKPISEYEDTFLQDIEVNIYDKKFVKNAENLLKDIPIEIRRLINIVDIFIPYFEKRLIEIHDNRLD